MGLFASLQKLAGRGIAGVDRPSRGSLRQQLRSPDASIQKTTGDTVHNYVERIRIARAQRLICETDLPFKTIAAELGFSTPSGFSFAFRRVFAPGRRDYRFLGRK
jgi:transcriptional regulator GlxA family with amidase domain